MFACSSLVHTNYITAAGMMTILLEYSYRSLVLPCMCRKYDNFCPAHSYYLATRQYGNPMLLLATYREKAKPVNPDQILINYNQK